MATQTIEHLCSKSTKTGPILEPSTWTHVVATLESVAHGTSNTLKIKGSEIQVEPGQVLSFYLSPGDKVSIKSNGTDASRWSFIVSELQFIDDIIGVLCRLGGK